MSPEIKTVALGSHGHVPKSPNHENEGCRSSQNKSKSHYSKMKQNNHTEILGYSLPYIYHKNDTEMTNKCLNHCSYHFPYDGLQKVDEESEGFRKRQR